MSNRELFAQNGYNLFCKDLTLSGDLNMDGDLLLDDVHVTGTTDSSSVTTGALIVDGGAGIAKKLHTGDTLTIHNITDTSKYTDLSTNTSGELLIYASGGVINTHALNNVSIISITDATNIATGALHVEGGASIKQGVHIGLHTVLHNSQDSSKTMTQSVDTSGNATIVTNGNSINMTNTTQSTSISTGTLIIDGGCGIAKNLYVGALYLPTTGGTQTALTYYEEGVTFAYNLGGALVDTNLTGSYTRINNQVIINFNAISASSATSASLYTGADSVPVRFRPSVETYGSVTVMSNSAVTAGTVKLMTNGTIVFYTGSSDNFSGSGNNGVYKCSIIYTL